MEQDTCSEIAIAPVRIDAARAGEPQDLYLHLY